MVLQVSVVKDDVTQTAADVLLLKHAQGFFGADEAVALRLTEHGAWGLKKPVILVAREGQRLHFDVSHHKCLFYKNIGKLSESLEKTIRDLCGAANPGSAPHA